MICDGLAPPLITAQHLSSPVLFRGAKRRDFYVRRATRDLRSLVVNARIKFTIYRNILYFIICTTNLLLTLKFNTDCSPGTYYACDSRYISCPWTIYKLQAKTKL